MRISILIFFLLFVSFSFQGGAGRAVGRAVGGIFRGAVNMVMPSSIGVSEVNNINFNPWDKGIGAFYTQFVRKSIQDMTNLVQKVRGDIQTRSLSSIENTLASMDKIVTESTAKVDTKVKEITNTMDQKLDFSLKEMNSTIYDVHEKTLEFLSENGLRVSNMIQDFGFDLVKNVGISVNEVLSLLELESKHVSIETKLKIELIQKEFISTRKNILDRTKNMIHLSIEELNKEIKNLSDKMNESTIIWVRLFILLAFMVLFTVWMLLHWTPKSFISFQDLIVSFTTPAIVILPISLVSLYMFRGMEYLELFDYKDTEIPKILASLSGVTTIYSLIHIFLYMCYQFKKSENVK